MLRIIFFILRGVSNPAYKKVKQKGRDIYRTINVTYIEMYTIIILFGTYVSFVICKEPFCCYNFIRNTFKRGD